MEDRRNVRLGAARGSGGRWALALLVGVSALVLFLVFGRREGGEPGRPAGGEEIAAQATPTAARATARRQPSRARRDTDVAEPGPRIARISGRVVDTRGRAISGAAVHVMPYLGLASEIAEFPDRDPDAVSDREGRFELEVDPRFDRVRLQARHAGYADGRVGPLAVLPGETLMNVEIVLQQGGAISGIVVDPEGEPIPAASVFAMLQGSGYAGMMSSIVARSVETPDDAVLSDMEGRFRIANLASGRYTVAGRAPGHSTGTTGNVEVRDGAETTGVVLTLPPGFAISGRVLDSRGAPVAGAEVQARSEGFQSFGVGTVQSVSDGRYFIDGLPEGSYALTASKEGHGTAERGGVRAGSTGVDLVLPEGGGLRGRLVRADDGRPVTRYRLELQVDSSEQMKMAMPVNFWIPVERVDIDDPEGRFFLEGVDPGRYRLALYPEGLADRIRDGVTVFAGETTDLGDIEIETGAVLVGIVVDESDGRPLADAEVFEDFSIELYGMKLPGVRERGPYARTDERGRFRLPGLGPGVHKLTAQLPGYSPGSVEVEIGEDLAPAPVRIALARSGTVIGLVLDRFDRTPISGVEVRIGDSSLLSVMGIDTGGRSATTDRSGVFEIRDVPPGELTLRATHPEYSPATVSGLVMEPGGVIDDVRIRMSNGGRITGSVLDEEDRPLVGAALILHGGNAGQQTSTDEDGRYEFRNVAPGSYTVALSVSGEGIPFLGATQSKTCSVEEGRTTVVNFHASGGVAVYGWVTRGGEPVTGAMVTCGAESGEDRPRTGVASAVSDEEGFYEITGLQPGTYNLVALPSTEFTGTAGLYKTTIEVGRSDVQQNIELPQAAVAGRVETAEGEPVPGAVVLLSYEEPEESPLGAQAWLATQRSETNERGEFLISDLNAGSYLLVAEAERIGRSEPLPLRLEDGEMIDGILLVLGSEGGIAGRVYDRSNGMAVAGATIAVRDAEGRLVNPELTVSDGQGAFSVPSLPAGTYQLTAARDGFAPTIIEGIPVSGSLPAEVDVPLGPGGDLLLTISDPAGAPRAGLYATLEHLEFPWLHLDVGMGNLGTGAWTALSNGDGEIHWKHLTPGPYRITAIDPSGPRKTTTAMVREGHTAEAEITLR